MKTSNSGYTIISYIVIICLSLFLIGILIVSSIISYRYKDKKSSIGLAYNHIYYIEGGKEQHPFYKWVKNDLNVAWVPTYIIAKNDKIIGSFKGELNNQQFQEALNKVLQNPTDINITDIAIKDLDGNEKSAKDIFTNNNKYTVIEWNWVDCPDCQNQDKLYTANIYKQFGVNNFYRIYNRSDINSIKQHHNF